MELSGIQRCVSLPVVLHRSEQEVLSKENPQREVEGSTNLNNAGQEVCPSTLSAQLISLVERQTNTADPSCVEEAIKEANEGMLMWTKIVCDELGLDPTKLVPLLPEIITQQKFYGLQATNLAPVLAQMSTGFRVALVQALPLEVIVGLPEEVIYEAFSEEDISNLCFPRAEEICAGGYSSRLYKITVVEKSDNIMPAKEMGAHEGNHAISSLLRSLLGKRELIQALTRSLGKDITCGSTPLYSYWGISELPYIPSERMRGEVAAFLENIVSNLNNEDPRIVTESYKSGEIVVKVKRLSDKGVQDLFKIAKRHNEFLELFDGEEDAKLVLKNLIEIQISRFNLALGDTSAPIDFLLTIDNKIFDQFSKSDVQELKSELNNSDTTREFALTSAENFLHCLDGNIKIQLKARLKVTPTPQDLFDYLFCEEETDSFYAQTKVSKVNGDSIGSKAHISRKENNDVMASARRIRIAPQDIEMVKQENRIRTARIRFTESLWATKKFISDELGKLEKEIPGLKALIEENNKTYLQCSLLYLKQDPTKLESKEHYDFYGGIAELKSIKHQMKTLLIRSNADQALIEKLSMLINKEDEARRFLKSLEDSLDEDCLDPVKRLKDASLFNGDYKSFITHWQEST